MARQFVNLSVRQLMSFQIGHSMRAVMTLRAVISLDVVLHVDFKLVEFLKLFATFIA